MLGKQHVALVLLCGDVNAPFQVRIYCQGATSVFPVPRRIGARDCDLLPPCCQPPACSPPAFATGLGLLQNKTQQFECGSK